MKIAIIGTGYVGLVSGVCFSDFGHVVTCVDKNHDKIDTLNSGGLPIYEPGLKGLLQKNVTEERLFFTTDIKQAVKDAAVVFIAVGTPENPEDGSADLSYVLAAAEEIAHCIDEYTVIVTKSTVPVGTGDRVDAVIKAAAPDAKYDVVSNPEFLREGAAIDDFKRPDRIVIGAEEEPAFEVMKRLYGSVHFKETPLVLTNRKTSELIKYASNAFLVTKITFINEMADFCEMVGADIQQVSRGIGLDSRIGSKFLNAGPGYGGSCFPKDTMAVVTTARNVGASLKIVEAVVQVNADRKNAMIKRVIDVAGGDVSGKTISILGLAFKPNTDDMRESPAIPLVTSLHEAGAKLRVYDPEALEEARRILPDVKFCEDAYDCAAGADVLCIVTEWDAFKALDFPRLKTIVNNPILLDLRNIYNQEDVEKHGFKYSCIGRYQSKV